MTEPTEKACGTKKVKVKAKNIVAADVTYISLVERGANRIPFRITKSESQPKSTKGENAMLHLDKLFQRKTAKKVAQETKPVLSAIAVRKEDSDIMKPRLLAMGFKVDNISELENSIVFKQEDFEETDVQAIAISSVLAGLVRVQKGFDSWPESLNFADNLAIAGFYPGVSMGMDALMNTIRQIMYTATDSGEAANQIGMAIDEFKAYALSVTSNLPVDAFKLETLALKVEDTKSVDATIVAATDAPQVDEPATNVTEEEVTVGAEASTEEVADLEKETSVTTQDTQKQDSFNKVLEAIAGLTKKVDEMSTNQQVLQEQVAKQEEKVGKLHTTVKGTVVSRTSGSEETATKTVAKSDGGSDDSVDWDTAFEFPGIESH